MLKLTIYTYGLHVLTPLTLWSIPNMVCMVTISRTQWLLCYHAHWINLSDFYWAFSSTQWQWWLSYEEIMWCFLLVLLLQKLGCSCSISFADSVPFIKPLENGVPWVYTWVNITCPLGDFIQLLGRIMSTHQWPKHYSLYHTRPQNFTHVYILHVNLH